MQFFAENGKQLSPAAVAVAAVSYTHLFKVIRENYRPEKDDYKLDLELDGCELELFSGKHNPPRPSYPEALGLRHLAFRVEDMDAAVRELNEKGVDTEPVRMDQFTGRRMTFFHDPDGLPLELHE